ncbi:NAD(P)-dependent dehydrogenase, short-chain alcohol dehydrogenase family [Sporobacter termitidis DSM 10068]|uniref:NAD(P)-dependent dehydrogenase, short-chain alcohol dehydrogenase family n=1 Tax=Sporobacter termitidis DSM 10068 TaxID=1123282 RepID=A0A1M5YY41_9FIRM|nr:SDR family oxidoreductase [Sporobacter termitidis]SHI16962.1 NAD(P)-dependent dehydrogenase, short-chain alcohol dehydrogenase family [Sporobacter termitidis DSM 10068]
MPTITYKEPAAQTPAIFPAQKQPKQPGAQQAMNPAPITDNAAYSGSGKLRDRVAIVTGGDSGIGQAAAIAFAKEGADVAIVYLDNNDDAMTTKKAVEKYGRRCFPYALDLKDEQSAAQAVQRTMKDLGKIDVLVNNIAVQYPQNSIEDITAQQLQETFATNIFSYFYMIRACLPNMKEGACIINTSSITAYKGDETLIDYSATKGAVVSMTRSLSMSLIKRGIRVNAVAPGPVWTPLIPSSFSPQEVEKFGQDAPIGRAAQPFELAPTYVYLACDDSAYVSGQVLHVNGGTITES